MSDKLENLKERLLALGDESYKRFSANLQPIMPESRIIGIRIPQLRKLAKDINKNEAELVEEFMANIPHFYFEEETLHMFLIQELNDPNVVLEKLDVFLPTVTNWATSDSGSAKILKKHPELVLPYVDKWLKSNETYTTRYAIHILMTNFLEDEFNIKYPERISEFKTDEYYIQMMVAWYFAELMVKQRDVAITFFENEKMADQTHNTAIQKSIDSTRVSKEDKDYLRTLRKPGGGLKRE